MRARCRVDTQESTWWQGLTIPHKRALVKACGLTEARVAHFDNMSAEAVTRRSWAGHRYKSYDKNRKKRLAEDRKAREANNYKGPAASYPGKVNGSSAVPNLRLRQPRKREAQAAAASATKEGTKASSSSALHPKPAPQDGGWVRDLTAENIHPHPGPGDDKDDGQGQGTQREPRPSQRQRRQQRRAKCRPLSVKIWQLNLASFALRGWDLLASAANAQVDIVLMQETRLAQDEAERLCQSLRGWRFFHQAEVQPPAPQRGRAEGGVAVAVREGIPAVRATSYCDEGGQWLRVTTPSLHVVSCYRRQLPMNQLEGYNAAIAEDVTGLGRAAGVHIGGDFNHEPLTDPLNVLMAGSGGVITYPHLNDGYEDLAEGNSEEVHVHTPAPTRWEGEACLDWGVNCGLSSEVGLSLERWSDHKLLVWNLANLAAVAATCHKLKSTLTLGSPQASPTVSGMRG